MKREHIFLIFIFFLTFLSIYLLYQILSPFLSSIIWAILLAIVFYPLFQKFQRLLRKREILSAMMMTLLVLIVIILPFTLLMASLASEVVDVYHRVEEMIKTGQLQAYWERIKEIPILKWILIKLSQHIDVTQTDPLPLLLKNLKQVSTFIFNQTTTLVKGFSSFVAGFFFTLLSYYLLKMVVFKVEGDYSSSNERDLLIQRFKDMIYATIYEVF
jgi:predicted PurR-regulated permease PerM